MQKATDFATHSHPASGSSCPIQNANSGTTYRQNERKGTRALSKKKPVNPEEQDIDTIEETPEAADAPGAERSEQQLLQEKYDDLNDRYLRLMAEYDNYRKRSQKEKDDIYPNAVANTIAKFLPVIDSLDRASQFDYNTEDFSKGFDMICTNFGDILKSLGVEEVGVVGEPFDPNIHNAAMRIEDEELGENVVSQVFQKGYKMGDKVIRYAMVQTAN
ncbi:nucleotide exchange factor GrpE [Ruminococcaceae bacterium OttesenSCG-928-L11]|nr:nucleotide exchange factor GrpE [Ruminococcaceae bacterium OttesenSCG-928-L11]